MRAEAIYETDDIKLTFDGEIMDYEEGSEVEDIKCLEFQLFGITVDLATLPEEVQARILEIAYNDGEFEPSDSSDLDDIDD